MLVNNVAFVTVGLKSFRVCFFFISSSALFIGKSETDVLHLVRPPESSSVEADFVAGICLCDQQTMKNPARFLDPIVPTCSTHIQVVPATKEAVPTAMTYIVCEGRSLYQASASPCCKTAFDNDPNFNSVLLLDGFLFL